MASRIDEFIDTREKGSSLGVNELSCQFAVIGAGPYGLAVTSHLRSAGFHVRAFGEPMGFWNKQMPKGMLLKSPWDGSHISDPNRAWTLDRYAQTRGAPILRPAPLEDFVRYGQWFQQQAVPDLDFTPGYAGRAC